MGCPTSDELGTPDGVGRFQVFDNGSIYWTPDTGAHAVWGAIRQRWADLGWERGYLGYPLSDEITNPDGYERGHYGYPTSEEYREEFVGGNESNNTGVRQNFQNGRYILYSGGQSNAFESCHTACVGYGGITNTKWVKKTEVYMNLADQNKRSTHVTPTDAAFASTTHSDTASSDSADNWKQVWSNTLMFPHATQGEMHSTYEQLYCHASYSYSNGDGGHWGGATWDLEAWRYDMVPYDAGKALQTKCNWGG
ncbi:LGFP repeat-containing protein [Kitasatospora sp. NPDC051853]|uniref:LGFP repeat-containing protein n=1 Tax=Kitasatospora sp. NPDC051853 TaxID=3364058 RepID=UPI00379D2217